MTRRIGSTFWLAGVRLAHRPGQVLLAVFGIAFAVAMFAVVQAGTLIAQDRSVATRIGALSPDLRAVRVASFGGGSEGYAALDRQARRTLGPLLDTEPVATVLYRESTIAGSFIGLGAVDGLSRWVELRSGRLPQRCSAARCEVLRIRGEGPPPNVPGLRLVTVGTADFRTNLLFGDAISPVDTYEASRSDFYRRASRYHLPAPPPVFFADGVGELSSSPVLESYRTFGWVVPIESDRIHPWSIESLLRRVETARSTLKVASASFELRAPIEELERAIDASAVAGRRLLLLGGGATALLLAFAMIAAAGLRRRVDTERQRLTWLGVPQWQIVAAVAAEAAFLAGLGAVVGWGAGVGSAALLAAGADEPVGTVLVESVLSGDGIALALTIAGVAFVVLVAALTLRPVRFRGHSLSPLDIVAICAAAAVAVALARGDADVVSLRAEGGTGTVLLLMPALIAFVAAVVFARVLPPALRLLEHAARKRAFPLRLALVSLARNPGHAAVTVGFLVVSLGLALFTANYRSTLVRGEHDQAAFSVPADFVLREDLSRLVPVREAVAPSALRALGPGVDAKAVTRLNGSVGGTSVTGVTVLGLEPAAVGGIGGWRGDFSRTSLSDLASRLDEPDLRLNGAPLGQDARRLILPLRVEGRAVRVFASVEAPDGSFNELELVGVRAKEDREVLSAPIPPQVRGGRLVALRFVPVSRLTERGANAGGPGHAIVTVDPLLASDRSGTEVVTNYRDWRGLNGVRRVSPAPVKLQLTLTDIAPSYFRPSQPTDGHPLPAIVSPRLAGLAGAGGLVPLEAAGERVVVRVAGVAERFPGSEEGTLSGDFAVLDRDVLVTALNAAKPGDGFTNELWINTPPGRTGEVAEQLRKPPYDVLDVASHRELETALQSEPIARTSLIMLAVASIVALVLALVGLLLGAAADLRDKRGELFDLEAQGLGPSDLRRQIRISALVLVTFGLAGAVATGLVLSSLVVRFVVLTANATLPEPPLLLTVNWEVVALSVAVVVCLAAGFLALITRVAFRGDAPIQNGGIET